MLKTSITLVLTVSLAVLIFLSGCQTLSSDKEQQVRKFSRISNLNRRMLNEDIQNAWLLDRPSYLSRWIVRSN
jgi:hypothetical protein